MKQLIFILFLTWANTAFAQYQNLDQLPEKKRNKILVKIANEAIDRRSIGYLRPGAKPIIEDIGVATEEKLKNIKDFGSNISLSKCS